MKQTKKQSLMEIGVNTVIGFALSVAIQMIIYPLMGLDVSIGENIYITLIFMVVGILRSYLVRRAFNRWHNR
tara:strand:- start:424 stop:639 length:216 start_codon:yes stop_codon:yes gene_type:complete